MPDLSMPDLLLAQRSRRSAIERGCGDPLVDALDHDPILRRYAVDAIELDRVGLYAIRARLLDDSHAPVRLAAGERLARAAAASLDEGPPGRAEVVGWLHEALSDPMPSVREVACRGLARHAGRDPACEATLMRLVTADPIWWIRRAAARALAAVAGEDAIPSLIPALEDPFWRVRHGVVQALELIVRCSGTDETERERLRLRTLAAGAGLDEAARAALAYLASGWPEGDAEVPEVLGIIRDPGAGLELADADPAVVTARLKAASRVDPAALVPLLAESHEALRDEATRRLAALDDPDCIEPALAWLEDPRVPNAPAAVRSLLARLGDRARGLAGRALVRGRPGGVVWAAGWVAQHRASELHDALLGHAEHPNVEVRAAVVAALGQLLARERGQAPDLRARLLADLDDPALEVRDAAALGLAGARVFAPLATASATGRLEVSPRVRAEILTCCADVDACLAALDHVDARVRAAAITTLDGLGRLAPEVRARSVCDPDPRVRIAAIDAEHAAAMIGTGPEDPGELDPSVRRVAARVLVTTQRRGSQGWGTNDTDALAHVLLDVLLDADDPWLRARGTELVDPRGPFEPGDRRLAGLLRATRDEAAMVRLAASARLDQVPELGRLLEGIVAEFKGDPDLAIAAWSRLLLRPEIGGRRIEPQPEPEPAPLTRIDAALRTDLAAPVRDHLRELAVVFGGPAPVEDSPTSLAVEPRPAPSPALVERRPLGRTGIEIAPMIVSGAFGLTPASLAHAAERGVDTYFWEPRYTNLTRFLRQPRRQTLQVVAGSFHADRHGLLADLERARRQLRRETIDLFLLFWVRSPARLGAEALETLREFQAEGWIRSYGFSTHDRPIACAAIEAGDWPVIMTRHSAAHRGAEQELLPAAAAAGVGVIGFSSLCYGRMLRSSSVFQRGPAAADCYRYSLAQAGVAACVSAPRRHRELDQNLAVIADTGLGDDRRDALIAHGTEVYADNKRFDRLLRRGGTAPLREAVLELFELASEAGVDGSSSGTVSPTMDSDAKNV